jgi:hypothetical protein
VAIRCASSREYPQGGRSSVARPSNQEKSQPSTGTLDPSASRSSNDAAATAHPADLMRWGRKTAIPTPSAAAEEISTAPAAVSLAIFASG